MGIFRRKARDAIFGPQPIEVGRPAAEPPDSGPPSVAETPVSQLDVEVPEVDASQIRVARTLVMSEPELAELVAGEPRLSAEGVEVSLVEKGFGTRVEIRASEDCGLAEDDLEHLLDTLAEPQKRPFSAS